MERTAHSTGVVVGDKELILRSEILNSELIYCLFFGFARVQFSVLDNPLIYHKFFCFWYCKQATIWYCKQATI